ncbi:MAG: hypothetical protein AB1407_09385 [Spirochaetota bacterium]
MGLAIAIILGLVAMTAIAGAFDYLGKRSRGLSRDYAGKIESLEQRVQAMETSMGEKDAQIRQLETKVDFMDRLLEDRRDRSSR